MVGELILPLERALSSASERARYSYEKIAAARRLRRSSDTLGTIGKWSLEPFLTGRPSVIVDAGAHVGRDSMEFSMLLPEAKIYAFEADPRNFRRLASCTSRFPNIIAVFAALTDECGVVEFIGSSGLSDGSGSILVPTLHRSRHPQVKFHDEDPSVVPAVALSDYLRKARVPKIDLLWADVQGAERLVLEGAREHLSAISLIYAEVSVEPLYDGATTYADLKEFLASHSFEVEREFMPDDWLGEGNVLFRNSSL